MTIILIIEFQRACKILSFINKCPKVSFYNLKNNLCGYQICYTELVNIQIHIFSRISNSYSHDYIIRFMEFSIKHSTRIRQMQTNISYDTFCARECFIAAVEDSF